jgi:hypothetical protein
MAGAIAGASVIPLEEITTMNFERPIVVATLSIVIAV